MRTRPRSARDSGKPFGRWYRAANAYAPLLEAQVLRIRQLTAIRRAEQEELRRYMEGRRCLMAYLRDALDDEDVRPCGRCAVCAGRPLIPETAEQTDEQ